MGKPKNPQPKSWMLERGPEGTDLNPKFFVDSTGARNSVFGDLESWEDHVRAFEPDRLASYLDDVEAVHRMESTHFDCHVLVDAHTGFVYQARIKQVPVPEQLDLI